MKLASNKKSIHYLVAYILVSHLIFAIGVFVYVQHLKQYKANLDFSFLANICYFYERLEKLRLTDEGRNSELQIWNEIAWYATLGACRINDRDPENYSYSYFDLPEPEELRDYRNNLKRIREYIKDSGDDTPAPPKWWYPPIMIQPYVIEVVRAPQKR